MPAAAAEGTADTDWKQVYQIGRRTANALDARRVSVPAPRWLYIEIEFTGNTGQAKRRWSAPATPTPTEPDRWPSGFVKSRGHRSRRVLRALTGRTRQRAASSARGVAHAGARNLAITGGSRLFVLWPRSRHPTPICGPLLRADQQRQRCNQRRRAWFCHRPKNRDRSRRVSCSRAGLASAQFGFHASHSNSSHAGAVYFGAGFTIIGKAYRRGFADNTRYDIGARIAASNGAVYSGGVKVATNASAAAPGTSGAGLYFAEAILRAEIPGRQIHGSGICTSGTLRRRLGIRDGSGQPVADFEYNAYGFRWRLQAVASRSPLPTQRMPMRPTPSRWPAHPTRGR